MVSEMPSNKRAEYQDRDYDERNGQDQGLGVRSEYEPPTKEEFLQAASEPRQNAGTPHIDASAHTQKSHTTPADNMIATQPTHPKPSTVPAWKRQEQ